MTEGASTSLGFSILGDSISTLAGWMPAGWRVHYEGEVRIEGVERPEDTWWGKVIRHFGGHLVANSSFSGSAVEGFGFPAGCSDERIAALVGADGEAPDVVIVLMGINDYGWGGARNQTMGASPSASAKPEDLGAPFEVAPTVGTDALERFEAAYAEMLDKVSALVPSAEIWCLTLSPGAVDGEPEACWKYRIRGIDLDEYNDAIRRSAQAAGALVADVRAFGIDYEAVDGVHPSAAGMERIAKMVVAQIEGCRGGASAAGRCGDVSAALAGDGAASNETREESGDGAAPSDGAARSRRTCFKPSCAGCEFNDDEPEQWGLYCRKR